MPNWFKKNKVKPKPAEKLLGKRESSRPNMLQPPKEAWAETPFTVENPNAEIEIPTPKASTRLPPVGDRKRNRPTKASEQRGSLYNPWPRIEAQELKPGEMPTLSPARPRKVAETSFTEKPRRAPPPVPSVLQMEDIQPATSPVKARRAPPPPPPPPFPKELENYPNGPAVGPPPVAPKPKVNQYATIEQLGIKPRGGSARSSALSETAPIQYSDVNPPPIPTSSPPGSSTSTIGSSRPNSFESIRTADDYEMPPRGTSVTSLMDLKNRIPKVSSKQSLASYQEPPTRTRSMESLAPPASSLRRSPSLGSAESHDYTSLREAPIPQGPSGPAEAIYAPVSRRSGSSESMGSGAMYNQFDVPLGDRSARRALQPKTRPAPPPPPAPPPSVGTQTGVVRRPLKPKTSPPPARPTSTIGTQADEYMAPEPPPPPRPPGFFRRIANQAEKDLGRGHFGWKDKLGVAAAGAGVLGAGAGAAGAGIGAGLLAKHLNDQNPEDQEPKDVAAYDEYENYLNPETKLARGGKVKRMKAEEPERRYAKGGRINGCAIRGLTKGRIL